MRSRASYFKIGLFVIVAVVIAVTLTLILGAGALLRQGVPMETYVDESVQGLENGSAIYFRGVKVGRVKEITFATSVYETKKRYVMIVASLNPKALRGIDTHDLGDMITAEVTAGLRVRLNFQALTGGAWLEVDYTDPVLNPPLEIDWTPANHYIPSASSIYAKMSKSADELIANLGRINFQEILGNLNESLKSIQAGIEDAKLGGLSDEALATMSDLRETSRKVAEFIGRPEITAMLEDGKATVKSARGIVEGSQGKIDATLTALADASRNIESAAAKVGDAAKTAGSAVERVNAFLQSDELQARVKDLSTATANIKAGSDDLPGAVAELSRTLQRFDRLLASQQQNIDEIMRNMRLISSDIKYLTDYAKRYPSQVLFGEPPSRPER